MEGNLNMLPGGCGGSYGGLELQNSTRFNQQQPHHHSHHRQGPALHPSIHDVFPPFTIGSIQNCDQPLLISEYHKNDQTKNTMSDNDEDDPSLTEEAIDYHNDLNKANKTSTWQRVKWNDKMVRLLITAVSYIGEDGSASECGGGGGGGRRKYAILHKKGKWKSVSKAMAERGYFVSPQQCEDKFNDLNKRYKRLNDVLGRGISCQVVENPTLLDMMDHLSEKIKDDVRKILSSKHLFYEEMCSYHNGNRLHLPPDPALQRSLQITLKSRENIDAGKHSHDDLDEDENEHEHEHEHDGDSDDHDDFDETCTGKRMKHTHDFEEFNFGNLQNYHKSNEPRSQIAQVDMNQAFSEGAKTSLSQNQWTMRSRSLQIEERKIELELEMFELEKQRFKWEKFDKKNDQELEKMRLNNQRMKLENEKLALELKRRGMNINL